MFEWKKTALTVLITLITLLSAVLVFTGDESEVAAMDTPTADGFGYTWIDNREPDPKTDYSWQDIRTIGTNLNSKFPQSYNGVPYLYPMSEFQSFGFNFPFYGKNYDKVQIYPNGIIAFGPTDYGYAIYNYQSVLPNKYYYTPAGTIAPYWVYYGGVKNLYVYKGVTETGMKYWTCMWDEVEYYYYLAYYNYPGAIVQCTLYENGNIKVNIQRAYVYYSYYLTIGICNYERDIGTNYYWSSGSMTIGHLTDGRAVLFKQYKSDVNNIEFSEGFGPDKNVYPAFQGMGETDNMVRAEAYCEKGITALEYMDYTIIPSPQSDIITLRYDFKKNSFKKLGDPKKVVFFNDSLSKSSLNLSDPDNRKWVEFHYDFNFNWDVLDMVSVRFTLVGSGIRSTIIQKDGVFRVVAGVAMIGNLSAEDSKGRSLEEGDWMRGGDTIHLFGLARAYGDAAIPTYIKPPEIIKIAIKDQTGAVFLSQSGPDLDTMIYVDPIYREMEYKLLFINVTSTNDKSDAAIKVYYENGFNILIDSDNPGLPQALQVLPDGLSDQPSNFDDDRQVYLKFDDAPDQSSGVNNYYISVNRPKKDARNPISLPKGSGNIQLIDNLPEGVSRIYVWAEDVVGNTGNDIFIDVMVDLSGVIFSDFYPVTGVWLSTLKPTCQIFINDTATGVDPFTIEYEVATTKVGLVGNWMAVQDAYLPGTSLRVVIRPLLKNGKDNWIRFRAKDVAGNGPTESEPYNVWVDAEAPKAKLTQPDEKIYHPNPYQVVKIRMDDGQSGIDAQSIEYRLTTRGLTKWTPWKAYREGLNGATITVELREVFRMGSDNYVQVRARDVIGNLVVSPIYNVKINTIPVLVITSPNEGDDYREDQDIVFDASGSYDVDGDGLPSITWIASDGKTQTPIGENTAQVISNLKPGMWTITVTAKDKVGNEVMKSFSLNVIPQPLPPSQLDKDLDGMPDWFEKKFQTKVDEKDEMEDPDNDDFVSLYEYQNLTNPQDPRSHPPIYLENEGEDDLSPFSKTMWPIWALLAILVIAIIVVMVIARSKQDRAVKRIKAVRNMRRIMPSVSWDQITTTAYIAPMTQGAMLPGAAGPALPTATPMVPSDRTLPPAPEAAVQAQPAAEPAPAPAGTFQAAPAPMQYSPPQAQ
jgi:hypothetical protein